MCIARNVLVGIFGAQLGFVSREQLVIAMHAWQAAKHTTIDEELNREVALKEIQHKFADDEASRSRFRLEAEVTGNLEHPGIVPVYGLGQYADGRPFYAMRFIRGDSLQAAVERFHREQHAQERAPDIDTSRPRSPSCASNGLNLHLPGRMLELRELLGRFLDVCQAIAYAHSRGVLHRDLKPGNIMLGKYGETLVVDWGIAKAIGAGNESDPTSVETPIKVSAAGESSATQFGSAIGTPAYMSPEQAAGRLDLLGTATDIFSLGATLYCLLTGQSPQTSRELDVVLQRVQRGEFPRPRLLKRDLPKALEATCLKAMAREPQDRYESAVDLAEDISRYLADEAVRALPEGALARLQRFGRRHRHWFQAGVGALAVIAVLAVTAYVREARISEEKRLLAIEKGNLADRNARLADDNGKLADHNATLAVAQTQLARKNGRLANEEKRLREEAESKSYSLRLALAKNSFERGVSEYAAGRHDQGLLEMLHGWWIAPPDSPWPKQVRTVLVDRLTRGGRLAAPPLRHQDRVVDVAYSPNGNLLATASVDKTVRLWNARTGAPWGRPIQHAGMALTVAFSPDGERLATASQDATARLWDAHTGASLGMPMRHGGAVNWVAFSPNGDSLATASQDNTARLWDARTGAESSQPIRHDNVVRSVTFSPDSTILATASADHAVRLWNSRTAEAIGEPVRHAGAITHVAFSPDGKQLATASADSTACVWNVRSAEHVGAPMQHSAGINSIAFSPDSRRLGTASADKTARLWNVPTGEPIPGVLQHDGALAAIAFHPDGERIATSSVDKSARLWNAQNGEPIGEPMRPGGSVTSIHFSPDGKRLMTLSNQLISYWDALHGTRLSSPPRWVGPALSSAVSPDGRRMATGGFDSTIQIWDPETDAAIGEPRRHELTVMGVRFSPDSQCLASASADRTARLWDANTGAPIGVPMRHLGVVWSAAFSPDGERLATASDDKTVRFWDARHGTPIGEPIPHAGTVRAVAFSPDGKLLATGGYDKAARLWIVPRIQPPEDLSKWLSLWSGQRLNAESLLTPVSYEDWLAFHQQHDPRVDSNAAGTPASEPASR